MSVLLLLLAACNGDKSDLGEFTPRGDTEVQATDTDVPSDTEGPVDADGDGYVEGEDCDDSDPEISPEAAEICDGIDNDCNGLVDDADEGLDLSSALTFYVDVDGDGYGDPASSVLACLPPTDSVDNGEDCDDVDAAVNPDATEVCDGIDNDCDTSIDDDDDSLDTSTAETFYADADTDGFGDADSTTLACEQPAATVVDDADCDDADAEVNPDATEVCDGIDNDCDGLLDDDDDSLDTSTASTFYTDADSDGFGDADDATLACEAPAGTVADDTDCDDGEAEVNPDATEICDAIDNDCDGDIDDDDADLDPSTATEFYADADGDGYGDGGDATLACEQPSGTVTDDTDCDDGDADISPEATEICDDVDNDCDDDIDDDDADLDTSTATEFYADDDGDGYGDADDVTLACEQPSATVTDDADCDDDDEDIHPDAVELCDGVDNDCDGDEDEDDAWWDESWPYRILLELTGASTDLDGPPVVHTVDFDGALAELGDTGTFDEASLRVVLQDCDASQPELPSQFLDEVAGLLDKADHADAAGDGHGDVAFLYDTDGDTSALETLTAGDTVTFGLYFDTSGSDPAYTTGLSTSSTQLANDLTEANFSTSEGGLLDSLYLGSSSSLMSQTESCCGNGTYTSTWSETPMYTSATSSLEVDGPVVALLESTGSIGDYDFTYLYWLFDGRPELWSKTYQVTSTSVTLAHNSDFTSGIRPWESRHDDISGSATFDVDATDSLYADADANGEGVAFAYRHPPDFNLSMTMYDPYLISIGNDYADSGLGSPVTVSAGTELMAWPVMLAYPHSDAWADVQDQVFGLMEELTISEADPEALD